MSELDNYFPRWRQSLTASLYKGRSKPQSKYFQFANLSLKGFAQNRTLVFRGFNHDSNDLLAITDTRSAKYKELSTHPFAQIAWYFETSREQYRINCTVKLIDSISDNQHLREKIWSELSENAKSQFYWPSPLDGFNTKDEALFDIDVSKEDSKHIPPTFTVLLLQADYVDYLDLKTRPQTREVYKRDEVIDREENVSEPNHEVWCWSRVNP